MRLRFFLRITVASLLILAAPLTSQETHLQRAISSQTMSSQIRQNPMIDVAEDFLPRPDTTSPVPTTENLSQPACFTDGFHDLFSRLVEKVSSTAEQLRLFLSTVADSAATPHG